MEEADFSKIKKDIFKTPPDYFDNLESKIFERMRNEKEHKVIRLDDANFGKRRGWKLMMAITAAAACFACVIFFYPGENNGQFDLSSIDNAEIINYLNENADEVDLDFLVKKDGPESNTFELLENAQMKIDQDDLLDEVNVEELF